ncbi:hypothetical protein GCM10009745_63710 [Kribbella yunnanensis]|uniref:N-acetyltransferase domain-containing protein n=1 Tax=Kribbella yunnanensis TaxID=190194 RepID=A0ABN2IKY5_9ACTN
MTIAMIPETELTEAEDQPLRELLAKAFPGRADHFRQQSWWLARPQWRLILSDGGVPVAHLGIERRRIGVGDEDLYVAGVGHVCTDPAYRGRGLGVELMAHLREVLPAPFGFLTCSRAVQGFYEAAGWVEVAPGVTMTNVYTGEKITAYTHPAMVLGDGFPAGRPIDLRGLPW